MKSFFWRNSLNLVFVAEITLVLLTRGVAGEAAGNVTCPVTQYQCANSNCIPISWRCDHDDDCGDNSDETRCPSTTCADDEFHCHNGKCVPLRWTCDRDKDCTDGSDEGEEHCKTRTCGANQFVCDSGVCLSDKWRCDGTSDCKETDGEDEKDCPATCQENMFTCDDGQCISQAWRCDFDVDCKDKSDEKKCPAPPTSCKSEEYQCSDGACIKSEWVCDGDLDCNDKSDESECNGTTSHCSPNQFQCKTSGECIHNSWFCDNDADCEDESDEDCNVTCRADQFLCTEDRDCLSLSVRCNGDIDCQDGTDEVNCSTPTTPPSACTADQFDCGNNQCISMALVCDGAEDCRNLADESKDLGCDNNPCEIKNGGCEHECINLYRNKHRCDCGHGFAFMKGSTTACEDIDECQDNHIHGVCSQTCFNTKGGYKCGCINEYSLIDHRYCKAIGGHPELLLADKKDLRRFHLETKKYNLLLDESKVFGAIALDFDFEKRKFYWTDVTLESIFRADLDDATSVEVVVNHTVHTPDGLAVDWINKHIYWTDTGFDRIEVASLDGKIRKTLIDTDLDEPRAIVLDPNNGYVYWTDWGMHPKIERCGLNGENREIIVDKNITWPNGLTIDYAANRLYWIDAKLHTIESANLDGTQRVTVLQSHLHLKHPFAITVFEDYLYWTDWSSESVRKFSKFGRDNVSTIALDLHSPMDVHVFHPYRQTTTKRGKEFCGDDKQGCSHFCLPKPLRKISEYNPEINNHYTCACPNGFVLQGDGKTCTENTTTGVPTTARPTPVPCKADSPNRTCNRSSQVPPTVTTVPSPVTPETTENKTPMVEVSTEGPGGYTIVTEHNETKPHQPEHKDEENIGQIAAIVIGVLLALVFIAAVVCFMLYRKYSRNNGKSMNFDNPVYRKTTTEELIIEKNSSANLPSTLQPLTQTTHEIV